MEKKNDKNKVTPKINNKHNTNPNTSKNNVEKNNKPIEELEEEHNEKPKKESELEKLKEEVTKLTNENKKLIEKVQLTQAELINYRKRKDDEVSDMLKYANTDIVTDLLNVLDNLERALNHAAKSDNPEVKKYNEGINMIYANLKSILSKFEVVEINRVGEIFDPTMEQALLTDSVADKDNEVVLDVLQKGYKLKDRVIRPASVKINQK